MFLRILSFLIGFFLLISTSGLLVNEHFCQNRLQSISIYLQPESCGTTFSDHCNSSEKKGGKIKEISKKDNCCHNEKNFVKLDLDQYLVKSFLKGKKVDFAGSLQFDSRQILPNLQPNKLKFLYYKPPLIDFDRQTHLQVFLC